MIRPRLLLSPTPGRVPLIAGLVLGMLLGGCRKVPPEPVGEWTLDIAKASRGDQRAAEAYARLFPPVHIYSGGHFRGGRGLEGTWTRKQDRLEFTTDGLSIVAEKALNAKSEVFQSRFSGRYFPERNEIIVDVAGDTSAAGRPDLIFRRKENPPAEYRDPAPPISGQALRQASINRSLVLCAMQGRERDVKALLNLGADPNFREDPKRQTSRPDLTPLHLAAVNGNVGITNLLLDAGAQVDAKDDEGNTPLHMATLFNHREVVRLLVQHGASPLARNRYGKAPSDFKR